MSKSTKTTTATETKTPATKPETTTTVTESSVTEGIEISMLTDEQLLAEIESAENKLTSREVLEAKLALLRKNLKTAEQEVKAAKSEEEEGLSMTTKIVAGVTIVSIIIAGVAVVIRRS